MALLPNILNTLGLVFLAHAVYSAYEHSLLPPTTSPTLIPTTTSLPLDITLETLFSVLLLCIGVVLSSPDLKPIQWSVWAGELERSTEAREVKEVGAGGGNPYAGLEERAGFWDVRGGRKAFGGWVREGGK